VMLAWVIPFGIYVASFELFHIDITAVLFWVVFGAVVVTAATVYAEGLLALRSPRIPADEPVAHPPASAIVVAYLPNETDTIYSTVRSLLGQDYPGPLQVVLAYNTPRPLPIEQDLVELAALDPRLLLVRVGDSTSKAQNINAALQVTTGEIIGIFDSDHRPMPTAFRRAARWLADRPAAPDRPGGGRQHRAEVVQGRSVVRNGSANWLARMVAVEFEGIYAVAHPGRASFHGFGIFGGSNGYWRADVLDRLRMRPDMLTEDIDISIRAILEGSRIVVDRDLISEELAPPTIMALWSQRIRWSQGWHQVSRRQLGKVWRSPEVSTRQRLGASFLLGWREAYTWVAAQMIPIMAFSLLVSHDISLMWLLPVFIVATVFASAIGPIQALFAWYLAVPQLRRRHGWWWHYILVTGVLFGEFKGHVNRGAHLRELIGDRAWQVTPRVRRVQPTATNDEGESPSGTTLTTMGSVAGTTSVVSLDRPCRLVTPDDVDGDGAMALPVDGPDRAA
jgi:cellulose synthase/poly-beta-1,6-N-acetylglucosamine synthase-like glycosyltransferase